MSDWYFDACTTIGPLARVRVRPLDLSRLRVEMGRFQIRRAVVFHSLAWLHDFRVGNRILDEELGEDSSLVPCYAAVPFATGEMAGPDQWDARLRAGPCVWRILPRTHGFSLWKALRSDVFAYAESRGILVCVDIDEIDLRDLWTMLKDHPQLKLVIGNAGTSSMHGLYREFRRIYDFLDGFAETALETSFLIGFRGVEDIVGRFGARRLLFGTRMPFLEPGSSIARLQYAEISPEDRALIAHGNLEALLAGVAP